MRFFCGRVSDSDDPLHGMLLGVVIFGVAVLGLRLRTTRVGVGDAGIILMGLYIGAEWGGEEVSE